MRYLNRFRSLPDRKPIRGVKLYHDIEIDFSLYYDAKPLARVIAFIIDSTFQASLAKLFQALFSTYFQHYSTWAIENQEFVAHICAFAAVLVYTIFPLYTTGYTLGKRALGLRVVKADFSGNLGIVNIFLRELIVKPMGLFSFLPGLASTLLLFNLILILLNSEHRGLHDYLSSCRVISYRLPKNLMQGIGAKT